MRVFTDPSVLTLMLMFVPQPTNLRIWRTLQVGIARFYITPSPRITSTACLLPYIHPPLHPHNCFNLTVGSALARRSAALLKANPFVSWQIRVYPNTLIGLLSLLRIFLYRLLRNIFLAKTVTHCSTLVQYQNLTYFVFLILFNLLTRKTNIFAESLRG